MTEDDSGNEPSDEPDEPILGAHIATNEKRPELDDGVEVDTLAEDE